MALHHNGRGSLLQESLPLCSSHSVPSESLLDDLCCILHSAIASPSQKASHCRLDDNSSFLGIEELAMCLMCPPVGLKHDSSSLHAGYPVTD